MSLTDKGEVPVLGLSPLFLISETCFCFQIINKSCFMKRILLVMLISTLGFSNSSHAQGDLLITPGRVVFEGNRQKQEIDLVNIGGDTTTYSISFVQRNMREDGSFVTVEKTDSGQMFADPYLRIFPRQVTLAPGEAQVIMLQCRRKPNMAAGEYRSHLYFRSEKDYKPLGGVNSLKDTTALSVQLTPIFGMSIPVIIRSGLVNASSTLSDLELGRWQDTIQTLKLTINRTGNISIYGDITVEYIPLQGKPYQVGIIAGIGVYTCINKRNIVVKIKNAPGQLLKNGKLKVQYVSNGESKRVVYAENELEIK
jgi:hypothetical protein